MGKLKFGVMASGFVLATAFAAPAFAIGSDTECLAEGGETVTVKGSKFCLVQIRPEAYRGPEYDGNQLGITDCPGDVLNDGLYCMAPLTNTAAVSTPVEPQPVSTVTETDVEVEADAAPSLVDQAVDMAKDEAEKAAKKEAKKKAKDSLKKIVD